MFYFIIYLFILLLLSYLLSFTLYPQRGSQRERGAKRYGIYIHFSPHPLSSTSSHTLGDPQLLCDLPPVPLILYFRRSTEVSYHSYRSLFHHKYFFTILSSLIRSTCPNLSFLHYHRDVLANRYLSFCASLHCRFDPLN